MADYHPLITRAVEGLANNTAEARRTLYERARAALVAQLRGIDPPLSEAEITRERLALEDAIRKVEAESVRKARSEPRPAAPHSIQTTSGPYGGSASSGSSSPTLRDRSIGSPASPPPRPETRLPDAPRNEAQRNEAPRNEAPSFGGAREASPQEAARGESPASARSRLLGARSPQRPREEFKGFRQYGRDAADPDHSAGISSGREGYDEHGASTSTQQFSDAQDDAWHSRAAERIDDEQAGDVLEDAAPVHEFDQTYDFDDQDQIEPGRPRGARPIEPVERYREPRPPRSYRGLFRLAAVLIVLAAVGATVAWQWSNINALYQFLAHMRSRPTQTAQPPTGEPKFGGRVPQEQTRQPPVAATPRGQSGPVVAQRVVLYEEDPSNPQGKQNIGSAVWRTETVSPGSGLAPEVQIRADVTIPDRNMTVTWTLRRNTDQALPASHTIEIMFNLPADFAGGGIANVPGVLMKESEQARGVPLAGLAVKVTNGFFLIGLSAVDADVQRNLQLLKDRPWFDVPIVYNNGGRAILALEKGPAGERAFADAFAAWGK
jgi:hypothetical protein